MKREPSNVPELPPTHMPREALAKLNATLVISVQKPHLFHPITMPPRRLALLFGQPGDEKDGMIDLMSQLGVSVIEVEPSFANMDQMPAIMTQNLRGIAGSTIPIVIAIQHFERIANATGYPDTRKFFANIAGNILAMAPPTCGVLCLSDQVPTSPHPQDTLQVHIWEQFPRDLRVLFDLPSEADIEARLRWFFETHVAHCHQTRELVNTELTLEDKDYQAMARFAPSHISRDIDEFCQRVFNAAMLVPNVQISRAFIEPLLHVRGATEETREYFLATRDTQKDQWPFNSAVGRQHPVFEQKKAPSVAPTPTEPEMKTEST